MTRPPWIPRGHLCPVAELHVWGNENVWLFPANADMTTWLAAGKEIKWKWLSMQDIAQAMGPARCIYILIVIKVHHISVNCNLLFTLQRSQRKHDAVVDIRFLPWCSSWWVTLSICPVETQCLALCENMTSSTITITEVHNISQRHQKRSKSRPRATVVQIW